jgi:hypothetical protein
MSKLEVLIDFIDGRPSESREIPVQFRPGQEKQACAQLLSMINATGGVLDFGDSEVSLLPLASIKKITVKAPLIVGGNLCDLRALDATVNTNKVTL